MERSQVEQIAVGAGLVAILAAIATGRLPRWLRIVAVVGIAAIAGGVQDSTPIAPIQKSNHADHRRWIT